MESSKDSVNNRIDEVQECPQDTTSRLRTSTEQFIANSPLRETGKNLTDLSKAASDPGPPNKASDLLSGDVSSSADLRRSRASVRELSNLASANAPGICEDWSIVV